MESQKNARKPRNYQLGKIYKIWSLCSAEIYIGSTVKKYLSQRMDMHRGQYKQWKQGKTNKVMVYDVFDKYNIENCKIELLEAYPCNSSDELEAREGHYIRSITCINKVIPGRTEKEWREDNKDKLVIKGKKYREENRDKILEQMKQYYEVNKEVINDRHKQHYENNKEVISQKAKLEYTCECGTKCRNDSKTKHFRTIKHINFMKQQPITV